MSAMPVSRTYVESRPQLRVVTRPRTSVLKIAAVRTATFAVMVSATFLASSLCGNVMVEKARREAIRATERMRSAKSAEAGLQQQVEALTGEQAVNNWARLNGFVLSNELNRPHREKVLVAQID